MWRRKRGDIARVHLAGVVGNGAGEIVPADDGDAVRYDFFAGLSELAISAAFGGEVNYYGTWRHALDHVGGDEQRRFCSGNHGGGNDDVAFGDYFAEKFALAAVEVFILGARVAAGVFRVLSFDG